MGELTGKVCLVTGGTRGIGRAIVQALADEGADVVFNYSQSKDKAEELMEQVRKKGVRCQAYQANVASGPDMTQVVEAATRALGPVSVLVNNAGITRDKTFVKMSPEMWDEVVQVNLKGLYNATHAVLPRMLEAGWGRIINVSSFVGLTGNFGQTNYAMSKAGMIGFTKALAREVARKGVTVNAVAPGFIQTDMLRGIPEPALEQIKANTPAGRLGTPEEVAHAVSFLASPRAGFVTGHVLSVNGGIYM